jgi:hypothetical protein
MYLFLRECGLQIFPQKFLKMERLFSNLRRLHLGPILIKIDGYIWVHLLDRFVTFYDIIIISLFFFKPLIYKN